MSAAIFYLRCVSDNASHLINGLEFEDHPDGGVVSKHPVSEEVATPYGAIPGWEVIRVDPELAAEIEAADKAAAAARAKLLAPRDPTPPAAAPIAAPAEALAAPPPAEPVVEIEVAAPAAPSSAPAPVALVEAPAESVANREAPAAAPVEAPATEASPQPEGGPAAPGQDMF